MFGKMHDERSNDQDRFSQYVKRTAFPLHVRTSGMVVDGLTNTRRPLPPQFGSGSGSDFCIGEPLYLVAVVQTGFGLFCDFTVVNVILM